ncbi:hypothetical protein HER32_14775 [Hymenobacter sp. BT18]|uniref:hypothetical protein n=1 Tax=Hymenobacter sp. BT18 TaxID=2835648 RepID=UPI00143EC89F|nr:hypothetical protein [Hymenobacter sp. BT18]QIX62377.1 hypothetical protein HER32_14775 [Hymenobacter sp. BT18]
MQDDRQLIGVLFVLLLAIGTPGFLLLLAFLRRRHPRRLAPGLVIGLTLAPLLLVAAGGSLWLFLHYTHQKFNPDYWDGHPMERYTMRQNLIQSRRLIGLSPVQVRQLLGESSLAGSSMPNKLLYPVGYPPSLTTLDRPEVLTIWFRNRKAVRVQ